MVTVPAKVKERLIAGVKRFQPILAAARDKDINESDTVTILVDVLSDIFGYDKYTEITSEYAIKHTFCDLAIKLDGVPRLLIEIKAAGMDLKEQHIKQAVDYGSNSGVEWVILTNSVMWKVYRIVFGKPVSTELIFEFDLTQANPKKQTDLDLLYCLSREAMTRSSKLTLEDYRTQKQLLNRFTIGQILLTEPVTEAVRKVLKKMSADIKVSNEDIHEIIQDEVLKREVLDAEQVSDAKRKIAKALKPVAKAAVKLVAPETTEI